jgi:cysteine desulfurase/selenocysteine lyase
VSNVLGTVVPLARVVERARAVGAAVLVDGAQGIVHERVDVQALDCDFYAFSGHKIYGPSGVGVLYGKLSQLEHMPPYQTGGGMVDRVELEHSTFLPPPLRFEAGTPNVAGVIGLAAALDYLEGLDRAGGAVHERALLDYASGVLGELPGLRIIGTARDKAGVISFTLAQAHPSDISMILDQQGIAIRAGHHCAQPLMRRFGVAATARASFALYNTRSEVDALAVGLKKAIDLFG